MLELIRSSLFYLGYWAAILFYGVLAVLIFPLPIEWRHRIMLQWCSFTIFWVRITCGVRYQVIGRENMENLQAPYIILSKHQSQWETFILQILFFPATTILKKELLRIPLFGWGLRHFRPIAIDRSNRKEALRAVKTGGVAAIERGANVLLFPEGTRVPPGDRGRYARGGPEIAIESGKQILPLAHNAGYLWPGKKFVKKPGLITIKIGEPISPDGKTSRELTQEVEDKIESMMLTLNKPEHGGE